MDRVGKTINIYTLRDHIETVHGPDAKTQRIDDQKKRWYCPFLYCRNANYVTEADYCVHLFSTHTGKEPAQQLLKCETKLRKYDKEDMRKEYLLELFKMGYSIEGLADDYELYLRWKVGQYELSKRLLKMLKKE